MVDFNVSVLQYILIIIYCVYFLLFYSTRIAENHDTLYLNVTNGEKVNSNHTINIKMYLLKYFNLINFYISYLYLTDKITIMDSHIMDRFYNI